MSFILDALKKSEHERQRQTVPGLVESGFVRARPRLPAWAIALCALLAVNLIVLGFVLTRSFLGSAAPRADARAVYPASSAASSAGGEAKPDGAAKPFSPLDAAPVYAPEIPVPASENPTPEAAPTPTLPLRASSAGGGATSGAVRSAHRPDPVLNEPDYKTEDEEVLPTINEINLTGAQSLPELHLDVHVFATKPAERFVFINMRKYHEGATLEEGPILERIRRDGVILNYNGLRFLLPRQ